MKQMLKRSYWLVAGLLALMIVGPAHAQAPTISWLTFMGGAGNDQVERVVVDSSGNQYIVGLSTAAWGSPVRAYSSGWDVSVIKLDSTGALVWHTFLGGTSNDQGNGIALDNSGNIYVTGTSFGPWGSPLVGYTAGNTEGYVAKLNSNGVLQWHTFFGSSNAELGLDIAVDGNNNVYVTGASNQSWGTPINPPAGNHEGLAVKFDANGTLLWNTYFGGSATDAGHRITVDSNANVYITGETNSSWGTPINAYGGGRDSYVVKLDTNGIRQWNTFLGGSGTDTGDGGIAVDSSGNVYASGRAGGTWGTPVSPYSGGAFELYLAKLDNNGNGLWHTFAGVGSTFASRQLVVDGSGMIHQAGYSNDTWGTPDNPHSGSGNFDGYIATFDTNGVLQANTFLGGAGFDTATGFAQDSNGDFYVAGLSTATWGTPLNAYVSGEDVFVAKFDGPALGASLTVSPAPGEVYPGDTTTVDLLVSGAVDMAGLQADCVVDPANMTIQSGSFASSDMYTNTLVGGNSVDTPTGSWFGGLSLRAPADPLTGNATFATLTYQAITVGSHSVNCTSLAADNNGFSQATTDVPGDITIIEFGTFSGTVEYQGRTDHSNIAVDSTSEPAGATATSGTTDNVGLANLTMVRTGSYDIEADADLYLPNCLTINGLGAQETVLPATTLKGGDATNDNRIRIADATLIGTHFGNTVAGGADPNTDINADGVVNVQDLAILGGNFGLTNCQAW
ncbi:MAG: SBBP repeat-containing protein [Chloroflexota bacterium]